MHLVGKLLNSYDHCLAGREDENKKSPPTVNFDLMNVCVQETICFTPEPEEVSCYALSSHPVSNGMRLRHSPGQITGFVPSNQLSLWSYESQVGVYAIFQCCETEALQISIERDLACLDGNCC